MQRFTSSGKLLFWGLVLVVAVLIFALNQMTPLLVDDFSFTYGVDGEKITAFHAIMESEIQNYKGHTGRVLLHTFTQLFLMLGKPLFNLVNTAVYVGLTLLVYRIAWQGAANPRGAASFLRSVSWVR